MNVVIVNCVFPPEPVVSAKIGLDLADSLVEYGHAVTVLRPRPSRPQGFKFGPYEESLLYNTITLESYICPSSNIWGRFRESRSFGMATNDFILNHKSQIDVVYINSWPLMAQLLTLKACNKASIPAVIHVQDIYPESLSNKFGGPIGRFINAILVPLDSSILRRASRIVAISQLMKEYLASSRGIAQEHFAVVPNWQDASEFTELEVKVKDEKLVFMYLGNIGPVAGIDLLIKAFARAKISNARLCIAGSGSSKRTLMQEALKHKELDIVFMDVPEGAVSKTQSKADIMLLPIKKGAAASSIPSKLPAYMFSAKPIIVCADSGSDVANAVKQSECGWVCQAEEVEELAFLMQRIKELTPEDRASIGGKARSFALRNFSKEEGVKNLRQEVLSVLKVN